MCDWEEQKRLVTIDLWVDFRLLQSVNKRECLLKTVTNANLVKDSITEHYAWLRSLTADCTLDIADSFSHALQSDAAQLSPNVPKYISILSLTEVLCGKILKRWSHWRPVRNLHNFLRLSILSLVTPTGHAKVFPVHCRSRPGPPSLYCIKVPNVANNDAEGVNAKHSNFDTISQ